MRLSCRPAIVEPHANSHHALATARGKPGSPPPDKPAAGRGRGGRVAISGLLGLERYESESAIAVVMLIHRILGGQNQQGDANSDISPVLNRLVGSVR